VPFETGRTVSTTDQKENIEFFNVHSKVGDRPGQAWQPDVGLEQANLFSSMSFTTTQTIVPVFNNANQAGVELTINTTVAPGGGQTFDVFIDHFDFVTGSYFPSEIIGTVSGTGQSVLQTALPVPQGWRVRLVPSGAGTWTASGSQNSIAALKPTLGTPRAPVRLALTNAAEQTLLPAPGAGVALCVTDLTGSNAGSLVSRLDLKEGLGGTVRYSYVMAPRGGGFVNPLREPWRLPANTALVVQQTSAVDSFVTANHYVVVG